MCHITLVKISKQPTFDVEHLQINYIGMVWCGEEEGKRIHQNFRKFWHDLFVLGFKGEEDFVVPFLEHLKSEGEEPRRRDRGRTTSRERTSNKNKSHATNFIKTKHLICMHATWWKATKEEELQKGLGCYSWDVTHGSAGPTLPPLLFFLFLNPDRCGQIELDFVGYFEQKKTEK